MALAAFTIGTARADVIFGYTGAETTWVVPTTGILRRIWLRI